jgi:hypothetical protein
MAQGYPVSVVPETPKLSVELGVKTPEGNVKGSGKATKHKVRKAKGKKKKKKTRRKKKK